LFFMYSRQDKVETLRSQISGKACYKKGLGVGRKYIEIDYMRHI